MGSWKIVLFKPSPDVAVLLCHTSMEDTLFEKLSDQQWHNHS